MAGTLRAIISVGLALTILLLPDFGWVRQKTVRAITEPPGATIYVDGVKVGKSPCCVDVEHGKTLSIKARKEGYKVGFATIRASKRKVFRMVGGLLGIFPFIVPVGFVPSKDTLPDKILIRLEPKGGVAQEFKISRAQRHEYRRISHQLVLRAATDVLNEKKFTITTITSGRRSGRVRAERKVDPGEDTELARLLDNLPQRMTDQVKVEAEVDLCGAGERCFVRTRFEVDRKEIGDIEFYRRFYRRFDEAVKVRSQLGW